MLKIGRHVTGDGLKEMCSKNSVFSRIYPRHCSTCGRLNWKKKHFHNCWTVHDFPTYITNILIKIHYFFAYLCYICKQAWLRYVRVELQVFAVFRCDYLSPKEVSLSVSPPIYPCVRSSVCPSICPSFPPSVGSILWISAVHVSKCTLIQTDGP